MFFFSHWGFFFLKWFFLKITFWTIFDHFFYWNNGISMEDFRFIFRSDEMGSVSREPLAGMGHEVIPVAGVECEIVLSAQRRFTGFSLPGNVHHARGQGQGRSLLDSLWNSSPQQTSRWASQYVFSFKTSFRDWRVALFFAAVPGTRHTPESVPSPKEIRESFFVFFLIFLLTLIGSLVCFSPFYSISLCFSDVGTLFDK